MNNAPPMHPNAPATKPSSTNAAGTAPLPWWRFPIVWMVVGGPALVVVAAITTTVIAYQNVDPVLEVKAVPQQAPGLAPALQGRNRAAEVGARPAEK